MRFRLKVFTGVLSLVFLTSVGCKIDNKVQGQFRGSDEALELPESLEYDSYSSSLQKNSEGTTMNISTDLSSIEGQFEVSPQLPAGMTLNETTGEISGTPAEPSPSKDYTVTFTAGDQSVSTVLSFSVYQKFDVDSTADLSDADTQDGDCKTSSDSCTIRAALEQANSTPAVRTVINVPAGTYTLGGSALPIQSNVELYGSGTASTEILGGSSPNESRVIDIYIDETQSVQLEGIRFANGTPSSGDGAGIQATGGGAVLLKDCEVDNNSSSDSFTNGGGIYARGAFSGGPTMNLTIDNCHIHQNSLSGSGSDGGGIFAEDTILVIKSSVIENNLADGYAGGLQIYNLFTESSLIMEKTTVRSNTANTFNGGVGIRSSKFHMKQSSIYGNGKVELSFGTSVSPGDFKISNSTIKSPQNPAIDISNSPTIEVTHSTLLNDSSVVPTLRAGSSSGKISIKNSIVSNPSGDGCGTATIESGGYNLETANACGFSNTGDQINVSSGALFDTGTVSDNGGPTPTLKLDSSSPALDTIPSDSCLEIDQRGASRTGSANCDSGAFEL